MTSNTHNISIFGLGYVGLVTSGCLAHLGHKIIGVEIDHQKVDAIKKSLSPIKEPHLHEYIKEALSKNLFTVTTDVNDAINNTTISFICVGTPPKKNGSCNLDQLTELIINIAGCLAKKKNNNSQKHLLIIRSTIPPGTIEEIIIPVIEKYSNFKNNRDFFLCFHPEFLREGCAIDDFFYPPKYIVGLDQKISSQTIQEITQKIIAIFKLACNSDINDNKIIVTDYKTAEMVKYTDNIWHALKVTFANEIGTLAKNYAINAKDLMNIFCLDTKLNISKTYLKPGLSYGGSCLPKEIDSLYHLIDNKSMNLPVLKAIHSSNQLHFERVYNFIKNNIERLVKNNNHIKNGIKISWYGVSFKDNTDDLRNSTPLALLSALAKNYNVKFYDQNINLNHILESQETLLKNSIDNYQDLYVDSFAKLLLGNILILAHPINRDNIGNPSKELYAIIDISGNNLNTDQLKIHNINYINLY